MSWDEVRRALWRGCVPVEFAMRTEDVMTAGRKHPPSYYKMAPRLSYLFTACPPSVRDAFSAVGPSPEDRSGIWFEHEGRALPAHVPVGALYDWLMTSSNTSSEGDREVMAPWKVYIRFPRYGEEKIPKHVVAMRSSADAQSLFFSTVKQALHLRFNTAANFVDLPQMDQESLWFSVGRMNYEEYREITDRLLRPPADRPAHATPSFAPLRLLVRRADVAASSERPVASGVRGRVQPGHATEAEDAESPLMALQIPVEMGSGKTIGQAVEEMLEANPGTPRDGRRRLTIQGIPVPGETSLEVVVRDMVSVDLFVYIVLE